MTTYTILSSKDDVLICDPDGEYPELIRALGGTVITLRAGGKDHINAMEISGGDDNAIIDQAQFVMSIFERMEESTLNAREQSIIDRCVLELYTRSKDVVTLKDLRKLLLDQPEGEAKDLALAMERFTTGSLDIFAHATNVNLANRIICFDLHELSQQLRSVAMPTVTNIMLNRVNANWAEGKCTHIFIDEYQEVYGNAHSAGFFESAYRRFRKRGAPLTAIAQNVKVLLASVDACAMISNSELLILLNQAAPDREKLAETFHISEERMKYVRNSAPGCGLLRIGRNLIPFENSSAAGFLSLIKNKSISLSSSRGVLLPSVSEDVRAGAQPIRVPGRGYP